MNDYGIGQVLLEVCIPVPAEACGRARMSRSGHMYTPSKTRKYQALVKEHAAAAMASVGLTPFDCACSVDITATYTVPKSWSASKRGLALAGLIHPKKGDWDNVAKNICDGMNGLVYVDDRQIQSGSVAMVYGEVDEVRIRIKKRGLTDYEYAAATNKNRKHGAVRPRRRSTALGGDGRTSVPVQPGQVASGRKRTLASNHRRRADKAVVQ